MGAGVLGTQVVAHIAMVVPDVEAAVRGYVDLFGIEPPTIRDGKKRTRHYRGEQMPEDVSIKVARFWLDNIEIELVEPVGGPSPWHDALSEHGPSVHHIAFQVQDAGQVIDDLEVHGHEAMMRSTREDGTPYAYVDARAGLGAVLEILGA